MFWRVRSVVAGCLALFFLLTTSPASAQILIPGLSQDLFTRAFEVKETWKLKTGARIAIAPHHVVAAKEIASLVSALPETGTLFLLSPDHFSQGKTSITTTDESFVAAHDQVGSFDEDRVAVSRLLSSVTSTRSDPRPFIREHGVSSLLPFLARSGHVKRIVPIIVRLDASDEEQQALAKFLVAELRAQPNSFLLSSIDFSHYLPANVADFHDELSLDVIRALDERGAKDTEIDSPPALAVTLSVARELGLGDVTIHAHTNSLRLLKALITQEGTSHIIASFAPGTIRRRAVTTLLITNRETHVSAEDRFYRGQSLIVRLPFKRLKTAYGFVLWHGLPVRVYQIKL